MSSNNQIYKNDEQTPYSSQDEQRGSKETDTSSETAYFTPDSSNLSQERVSCRSKSYERTESQIKCLHSRYTYTSVRSDHYEQRKEEFFQTTLTNHKETHGLVEKTQESICPTQKILDDDNNNKDFEYTSTQIRDKQVEVDVLFNYDDNEDDDYDQFQYTSTQIRNDIKRKSTLDVIEELLSREVCDYTYLNSTVETFDPSSISCSQKTIKLNDTSQLTLEINHEPSSSFPNRNNKIHSSNFDTIRTTQ